MGHRIELLASAKRELDSLSLEVRRRVRRAIEVLSRDPRPPGSRKLRGGGAGFRRLRVGPYRVIYQVDDETVTVVIIRVGHRRDVYRGL